MNPVVFNLLIKFHDMIHNVMKSHFFIQILKSLPSKHTWTRRAVRSLKGNLRPRPWPPGQYIQAEVWDFPAMSKQMRSISHLLYGLFSMDLSLHLSKCYSQVTMVSGYLFDSCQLTITWTVITISTIKFKHRL